MRTEDGCVALPFSTNPFSSPPVSPAFVSLVECFRITTGHCQIAGLVVPRHTHTKSDKGRVHKRGFIGILRRATRGKNYFKKRKRKKSELKGRGRVDLALAGSFVFVI